MTSIPCKMERSMHSTKKVAATSLLIATLAGGSIAAPPADSPFGSQPAGAAGQIRLRSEVDHKSMNEAAVANSANLLRSRLSYGAAPASTVYGRVEIQDSRLLGSEHATVSKTANLDLSQAYAALSLPTGDSTMSLSAAFGRMSWSLGAGRFLSSLEWHPLARRFDGGALNLDMKGWNATALGFVISDSGKADQGQWLAGTYLASPAFASGAVKFELGLFYDKSQNSLGTSVRDVTTLDGRVFGSIGAFSWEQEILYQLGEVGTSEVGAFYSASRVGYALPAAKLNAGIDVMSGQEAGSKITRYTPSHYFGHAYFGWMDYFLANPVYGVVDLRLDAEIPLGKVGVLKPQVHAFFPQQSKDLAGNEISAYGQEFDLEFQLKTFPKSDLVFGAALFLPGDGAFHLGTSGLASRTASSEPSYYLYFMPTIRF